MPPHLWAGLAPIANCTACLISRNPQWFAHKVPTDFWLEDKFVYKASTNQYQGAMLVIVIANSQGVNEYLSPDRLACLQEGLLPLDGVNNHDSYGIISPLRAFL